LLGTYIHESGAPHNTFIKNNFVFLADQDDGVEIVNISDPIYLENNLVFVSEWFDGLEIIDISKPIHPEEIYRYNQSKETKMVYVDQNLIYVADGYYGLAILQMNIQSSVITFPNSKTESLTESTSEGIPGLTFFMVVLSLGIAFMKRKKPE
jgi:hypothetical protein